MWNSFWKFVPIFGIAAWLQNLINIFWITR
jgi:hypothetical protein